MKINITMEKYLEDIIEDTFVQGELKDLTTFRPKNPRYEMGITYM